MKKIIILLLSLTLLSCSSVNTKEEVAWTTSIDNVHFFNEKFNMTIVKPESWYAQSLKELLAVQQRGKDIVSGDDKNFKAVLENSLKTSMPLFGFYQFAPGTPTNRNSSLMGVADNISLFPGVKSSCDYLYSVKQLLKQSQVKMDFEDECLNQQINRQNISYFNAKMTVGENIVHQKYMACLAGDYAIAIIYTVVNEEDTSELDATLNSLKLQCDE